jgi:diacylglycerol O-acyltransferase
MSPRVSLSGLDSAFLSLETPTTPMNILGTFVLDASGASGYSYERLLERVEARAPTLAPLRRRMLRMPLGLDHPIWIDDPDLDVRRHVRRLRAPAPGSDRVLADLVARIASQRLDRARPLWQLWAIEGLSEARIALVFKLHHAVADGTSAALLLLQLLDASPERAQGHPSRPRTQPAPAPKRLSLLAHAVRRVPQRSVRLARLLRQSAGSAAKIARSATAGRTGGPWMPMPFSAPWTPWNRAISSQRTVAFGRARLEDVKAVGSAFDATLNHVVLAACTQTLRSYLESHGGAPELPLVAAIPVSLRGPEDPESFGNRISALLVHLPVHLSDPVDQLLALRQDADSSKQQHARLGVAALGEWAEFTSSGLLGYAARFYSKQKLADRHRPLHNLVISNVRGPGAALYAAGARLTAAYPLGPLMEGAGMNITILSYAGSVDFGIVACRRAVPHVSDIALGFGAAVGRLLKIALEQTAESPAEREVTGALDPAPESAGAG